MPFRELAATCAGGLEALLEEEITALGFSVLRRRPGVVYYRAALETAPVCVRSLRTASRLLLPVERFTVRNYDGLYNRVRSIPWESIVPLACTFAITATTRSREMKDHRFLAMRTKDGIVDAQRSTSGGRRSSIDRDRPHFRVTIFVDEENGVEISLDVADRPLHERGYRTEAGEAPLRETVAAAMLLQAGYTGAATGAGTATASTGACPLLIDPFCGSGTIAIEAALILAGRIPQLPGQRFAYQRWPWFPPEGETPAEGTASPPAPNRVGAGPAGAGAADAGAADAGAADAGAARAASAPRIIASDRDEAVVEIARRNARRAGVEDLIDFRVGDMREILPALATGAQATQGAGHAAPALVVTNPPYGERLDPADLHDLYRDFGTLLRQHLPGAAAYVLCSDKDLISRMGLRVNRRVPMFNGGLACRLYEIGLK